MSGETCIPERAAANGSGITPDSPEGAASELTERARAVEADRKPDRAYLLDLYHEYLIAARVRHA